MNVMTKKQAQPNSFIHTANMPSGWEVADLGELCKKVSIIQRKTVDLEGSFLYLDIGSIDNEKNKITTHKLYKWQNAPSRAQQVVFKNDILFSTVRTYLKNIARIEDNLYDGQIASSGFTVIRAINNASDSKFLFYLVISKFFLEALNKLQTGTSYPAVRDKDVFSQKIPVPPFAEQIRIVAKIEELFSRLDAGVDSLKKVQAQLKIYRQAVLKWAFEGKLCNTANLTSTELKHLCISVEYGSSAKSKEAGKIPVLRMGNIQAGKFDWSDLVFSDDEDEIKRYLLKKNDVLFNRTNSPELVGKTAIYKGERPAIFAGYLIRINYRPEAVNPDYLTYYMNSQAAKNYGNAVKSFGVNQSNINGTKLKCYPIPICTLEEQARIVEEIESRLSVCDKLEESIAQGLKQAEALKQSILKKAFEGKLVTQNPDDEPASMLLARIRSEREKTVATATKNSTTTRKNEA